MIVRPQRTATILAALMFILSLMVALLPSISIVYAVQPSPTFTNGQNATLVLGQATFTSSASAATQSGMFEPNGIAIDSSTGKVFVADTYNHRVLRFASRASLTNGANAEGVLGQANFTSNTAATTQSGMSIPYSVVLDGAGTLWVSEGGNNRVLRFDNAVSKANGANADGVLGQANFTSGSSTTTQSGMKEPHQIVLDGAGRLWVADTKNHRVLRFDTAASKANGANADAVLGQADFTSGSGALSQSRMNEAFSVGVDSAGTLWVSDVSNNRVLRFNNAASKANGANADGVLGQADFTSGGGALSQSRMSKPFSLAVDSNGRLWVADTYNHRVLWFDDAASKTNGANADGVLGQANFTSGSQATTQSRMFYPQDVAVDGNNQPWVADSYNHRVLYFGPPISTNANLSALAPSSGELNPTFAAATTSYTLDVGNGISSLTLTPTKADAGATITVNGVAVASGSASGAIALNVGTNTITVVVTAEDGVTTKTYTITITRTPQYFVHLSLVVKS